MARSLALRSARYGIALLALLTVAGFAASAHAAFPGENGKIVFISSGVVTMNADGSDRVQLNLDGQFFPAFSPDGRRIAFSSNVDGNYEIYVMNADGTGRIRLTDNPGFEVEAVFSADGTKIAFSTNRDGNFEIYVVNADGTGPVTNLTNNAADEAGPAFSPDGTTLAFQSDRDGDAEIFVMNADGTGAPTQLTHNFDPDPNFTVAADGNPNFSPDGTKIAFTSNRDFNNEIYVMNLDGSGQTNLTNTPATPSSPSPEFRPAFSPDGTKILFFSSRGPTGVHVMNADGSGQTALTSGGEQSGWDWGPLDLCGPSVLSAAAGTRGARASTVSGRSLAVSPVAGGAGSGPLTLAGVRPGAAVAGAAIELRGRGLAGRGLRVTVGGKRARVLAGRAKSVDVVIPKVRPGVRRVVARRGGSSSSSSVRVLRPFTGRIGAKVDTRRARKATIGPAGGEVRARGADGTSYALAVPPGALADEREITLVPVIRFSGLPLTGGRVEGARLLPDGLALAVPAMLTIRGGGRGFDRSTIGFGYGRSSGFELSEPPSVGRSLVLAIEHFSEQGGAEATEADVVAALTPTVLRPNMSREQIREALTILAIWDKRFSPATQLNGRPPSFCKRQPICGQVVQNMLRSLATLADTACVAGRRAPSFSAIRELQALQVDADLLGDTTNLARPCIVELAEALATKAKAELARDPFAPSFNQEFGRSADINGNGSVSAFEFAFALSPVLDRLATPDLTLLAEHIPRALEAILGRARDRCNTGDQAGGSRDLLDGFAYASHVELFRDEFLRELAACDVTFVVEPATAIVEPDGSQQFGITFTNPGDGTDNGDVTWAASRGTITAGGLHTAPGTEGTQTITATSTINPTRTATASVTVTKASCGN